MDIIVTFIIVLLIGVLIYVLLYEAINSVPTKACDVCPVRNVHRMHDQKTTAAAKLDEIIRRNKILMAHLKKKYIEKGTDFNPDKSNKIDIIEVSPIYEEKFIKTPGYIQTRLEQLFKNYDENNIYEISPLNKLQATSYTENKKKLVFCLRQKIPDENGEYPFHDDNLLMYVVLHELAHMMNTEWDTTKDHGPDFWDLFRFLMINAHECNIYDPVNFNINNATYCGMQIKYTPYYV